MSKLSKFSAQYKIHQILIKNNFLFGCYRMNEFFDITDYSEEAEFICRILFYMKKTRKNVEQVFHLIFAWFSHCVNFKLAKNNFQYAIKLIDEYIWKNVVSKIIDEIVGVYCLTTRLFELFFGKPYKGNFMDGFYKNLLKCKLKKFEIQIDLIGQAPSKCNL